MTEVVPIAEQVAEVKREIALRRNVYPYQVAKGKLEQGEADRHMRRIEGVLATLLFVERNAELIRRIKTGGST